jgi:peptide/nickel transport system substrate-binding protein
MSCAASYIIHPDFKDDTDYVHYNETLGPRGSHPNDLGPFVLTEWERVGGSDSKMVLEKNPYYWNTSLPMADKIIIQFYTDDTALAAAMTAGQVDVAYRHLTPAQVDEFKDDANFVVHEGIGAAIQYMLFQQTIDPYDEQDIRQGIAAALNRTNIAATVFQGTVDPLYSIVPAGMAYHKPSFEIYGEANYTFTQEMLALHGYDDENPLEINLYYESSGHYPSSAEQAAVYKSDLEASGVIEVSLSSLEWSAYREQRNAGTMDVFIYGWYPDYIDPDNYAFLPFASWLNLGFNQTHGGEDQYDLWTEGRSVPDDEREEVYFELQDLQAEQCSCIPLWQGKTTCVAKPTVKGIVLDITVNWRHWLLYLG